ncbi:MAG: Ankyrin, partial [uncultured Pseudonocardia sp.]
GHPDDASSGGEVLRRPRRGRPARGNGRALSVDRVRASPRPLERGDPLPRPTRRPRGRRAGVRGARRDHGGARLPAARPAGRRARRRGDDLHEGGADPHPRGVRDRGRARPLPRRRGPHRRLEGLLRPERRGRRVQRRPRRAAGRGGVGGRRRSGGRPARRRRRRRRARGRPADTADDRRRPGGRGAGAGAARRRGERARDRRSRWGDPAAQGLPGREHRDRADAGRGGRLRRRHDAHHGAHPADGRDLVQLPGHRQAAPRPRGGRRHQHALRLLATAALRVRARGEQRRHREDARGGALVHRAQGGRPAQCGGAAADGRRRRRRRRDRRAPGGRGRRGRRAVPRRQRLQRRPHPAAGRLPRRAHGHRPAAARGGGGRQRGGTDLRGRAAAQGGVQRPRGVHRAPRRAPRRGARRPGRDERLHPAARRDLARVRRLRPGPGRGGRQHRPARPRRPHAARPRAAGVRGRPRRDPLGRGV